MLAALSLLVLAACASAARSGGRPAPAVTVTKVVNSPRPAAHRSPEIEKVPNQPQGQFVSAAALVRLLKQRSAPTSLLGAQVKPLSVFQWADAGPPFATGTLAVALEGRRSDSALLTVFDSGRHAADDVETTSGNVGGDNAENSPADPYPGICFDQAPTQQRECELLFGRVEIVTFASLRQPDDPALELGIELGDWLKSQVPLEQSLTVQPSMGLPAMASSASSSQCTLTDTGSCIRGGEFCRASDDGQVGFDAAGDEYMCRSGHWENP